MEAGDRAWEAGAEQSPDVRPSGEKLPLLYQGLLTGIVRMKARRQHVTDADTFRSRTKALLQEVERAAITAGYDARDIRNTHFAVVAYLDSVVLNSAEPIRAEWERKPLQEELFGQADAGVVFFDKLEHFRSRRDSEQLADILEVFLLCILLGFEGRYSSGSRGELDSIAERLRLRIENIRGHPCSLAAFDYTPEPPPPPPAAPPSHVRFLTATIVALIITILLFVCLKWNLIAASDQIRGSLF